MRLWWKAWRKRLGAVLWGEVKPVAIWFTKSTRGKGSYGEPFRGQIKPSKVLPLKLPSEEPGFSCRCCLVFVSFTPCISILFISLSLCICSLPLQSPCPQNKTEEERKGKVRRKKEISRHGSCSAIQCVKQ